MPLISFFLRRFVTGTVARRLALFLERRFKMSPAVASVAFVLITEVLARATEKKGASTKNGSGRGGKRR